MKVNGVELEFDIFDYETAQAHDEALNRVQKETALLQKKKSLSSAAEIKEQCEIVNRFFDKVFGEGTSEKVFKGKLNLNTALKAFEIVIDEAINQRKAFDSNTGRLIDKWKAC